ncbi:hypothetical protein [Bartonella schoenbuchensis]|nr:hypothetical protein [Bartonella schoenbuchensis]
MKISGVTKGVSMEKGESLTISGDSRIEFTGIMGLGCMWETRWRVLL